MVGQTHFVKSFLILLILCFAGTSRGQQKPQWLPGQVGFNAGILSSPGFTCVNIAVRYNSTRFNGPSGNAILTNLIGNGNYSVWPTRVSRTMFSPGRFLATITEPWWELLL